MSIHDRRLAYTEHTRIDSIWCFAWLEEILVAIERSVDNRNLLDVVIWAWIVVDMLKQKNELNNGSYSRPSSWNTTDIYGKNSQKIRLISNSVFLSVDQYTNVRLFNKAVRSVSDISCQLTVRSLIFISRVQISINYCIVHHMQTLKR